MHKIDRNAVPVPRCLSHFRHGRDNWSKVTPEQRCEIQQSLEQLQGMRCAYCEGPLDRLGKHIDHFRCKSKIPERTFDWTNLFWSCGPRDHCGHFKDNGAGIYNPDELIDPSVEDPERFFRFSSDGSIRLRAGLSPHDEHRAQETLRVFNLQPERGPLHDMRKKACWGYVRDGADLAYLAEQSADPDEWLLFLEEEIEKTRHLPFATAIKHTLSPA